MTKWIKCSESQPENNRYILMWVSMWEISRAVGIALFGVYINDGWYSIHFDTEDGDIKSYKVNPTHWAELPEPPND